MAAKTGQVTKHTSKKARKLVKRSTARAARRAGKRLDEAPTKRAFRGWED